MRRVLALSLSVLAISIGVTIPGPAYAQVSFTLSRFKLPVVHTHNTGPYYITSGPDGNLWFTGSGTNVIGRITTSGVLTTFPVSSAGLGGITAGPDGNVWFTAATGNQIGRITPAGVITLFPIPTPGSNPVSITLGPDGNLWFTEATGNHIGRITPAGVITEYPLPANSQPEDITTGPDGNLWFTADGANAIGVFNPATDAVSELTIPNVGGNTGPYGTEPIGITTGPNGSLWFTEYYGSYIGQVTTQGVFSQTPLPPDLTEPWSITTGPDGNIWFTTLMQPASNGRTNLGQITATGLNVVTLPSDEEYGLASGPDGNIWVTVTGSNSIIRVNLSATAVTSVTVTSTANPVTTNQPVTYTATVKGLSGTLAPAGETATFYDGGSPISGCADVELSTTAPYTATCTMTYTTIKRSPHLIVAAYNGDSIHASSSSYPALRQKVTRPA